MFSRLTSKPHGFAHESRVRDSQSSHATSSLFELGLLNNNNSDSRSFRSLKKKKKKEQQIRPQQAPWDSYSISSFPEKSESVQRPLVIASHLRSGDRPSDPTRTM
jgi:septum formation inhibitor MinC